MGSINIKVATEVNGKIKELGDLSSKEDLKKFLKLLKEMEKDMLSDEELAERRKRSELVLRCKGEEDGFNVETRLNGCTPDLLTMLAVGTATAFKNMKGTDKNDKKMVKAFIEQIEESIVNNVGNEDEEDSEDDE